MPLTPDLVVVRDDEPVSAVTDGEVFMLSPRSQAYFGLGEVGSEIWRIIETPTRIADICTGLMEAYEVDEQTCRSETIAFLDKLLDQRLIRLVEAGEIR